MQTVVELNAKAALIGQRVFAKAIEDLNTKFLRDMRELTCSLYDVILDCISGKADYPQWREVFIKANVESPFLELDETGEFAELIKDIRQMDLSGYYFQQVMPIIANGAEPLIAERDAILGQIDYMVNSVIRQRRANIRGVSSKA